MKSAREFKQRILARVEAIHGLPISWPSPFGNRTNGDIWKSAAERAADELIGMIGMYAEMGYDWFDAQFEVRLVGHYNAEVTRRHDLEAISFSGKCECLA
ncbi:hypothetical protein [Acidimangrovimonas pyrenivorans]|uniref:Uncharacterized protein n=1 Tax=Acidimangrovimonas pyrenivorans TaxID=2030798 RepID=A0ABV7ADT8_9RHOB